jgi:hypothetical protein
MITTTSRATTTSPPWVGSVATLHPASSLPRILRHGTHTFEPSRHTFIHSAQAHHGP